MVRPFGGSAEGPLTQYTARLVFDEVEKALTKNVKELDASKLTKRKNGNILMKGKI